jgi:hypothetical protein
MMASMPNPPSKANSSRRGIAADIAHGLHLAWRSSSQQIRLDIQFVPSLLALIFQMVMSFKWVEVISSKLWPSPILRQKMCISMRR